MIKDKKKIKKQNQTLEKNQIRLNRILELLGVSALHRTLHRPVREFIVQNPDPPLVIKYQGKPPLPDSIQEVICWWEEATYKGMSSSDFIEVLRPLLRVINSAEGQNHLSVPLDGSLKVDKWFVDQYFKPAQEYLDFFKDEFRNLFLFFTWNGTSVDTRYIKTTLEWDRIFNQRMRTRILIQPTPAQSSYVASRLNYRVGCQIRSMTGVPGEETQWLSQSPVALGLPGQEDERLPVYISKHALDRMRERLDSFEMEVMIAPCTYTSMNKPGVHPLKYNEEGNNSLVEFRILNSGIKAGYFVVSRTEHEIFIKTFLFLTMQTTPEGQLLHRRLRMARPDFDFHQLEHCSTFKKTDIATHPTLVPIWEECGFSGLIKWLCDGNTTEMIQAVGDDFVKYFKL